MDSLIIKRRAQGVCWGKGLGEIRGLLVRCCRCSQTGKSPVPWFGQAFGIGSWRGADSYRVTLEGGQRVWLGDSVEPVKGLARSEVGGAQVWVQC